MNYEGLIGDPREPNSNSLLVCVKGLEEGPLYCSAQLAGCCFNGRWEINGDLMTVGRTQRNNRVLVQRGPSTLVSHGKCLHGCTYKNKHTCAHIWLIPRTHKHTGVCRCTQGENESNFYWFVTKEVFCTHLPSVLPVSSRAKQTELILNPPTPQCDKRRLIYALATWCARNKSAAAGLDAHSRIAVIVIWLLGCWG